MSYKLLLFDADHTLFDFDASERKAFQETMTDFDLPYDANLHLSTYKDINAGLWKALEMATITQKRT